MSPSHGLADFLRRRKEHILSDWEESLRLQQPLAAKLDHPALRDTVPRMIDRIAEMADALAKGLPPELPFEEAESHSIERLEHSYDLAAMVHEYAQLRECILKDLEQEPSQPTASEYRLLNRAIDTALVVTSERFMQARDRILLALERISSEALGKHDMENLLQRLLQTLKETSAVVDEVTILLRDGDLLRVSARVGFIEERDVGFTIRLGEGFAGTIAITREPLLLHDVGQSTLVKSEFLRRSGLKVLYGVPLVQDEELVGVAHMGSLRAPDFSDDDKMLFRVLANRAAALLLQAQLLVREQAARRAAELERERLHSLFLQAPAMVNIQRGPEHVFELVHPLMKQFAGRDVTGLPARKAIPELEGQGFFEAMDKAYQTGMPVFGREVPARLKHPDGTFRDGVFDFVYQPWRDLDGQVAGIMTFAIDVSAQAEARRRREEAIRRLEEERALREQFVATLSHDLRSPISAAHVSAQVILRRADDADHVRVLAGRIVQSVGRADQMIRDLLDANRIRAGEALPLHPVKLDLGALAREVVEGLATLHGDRFRVEAEPRLIGHWDPDLLRRALENLCVNAVKYGEPDSPITVTAARRDEGAVLEVHNLGPALSPEEQARLFQPFHRARAAEASGKKGWGLGLTLVRGAAEAHGGRVEVHSSPEDGTRFRLWLPFEPRAKAPPP